MNKLSKYLTLFFLFFASFFFLSLPASALTTAKRQEAEKYFFDAYLSYVHSDYWKSCIALDKALNLNTYMVDYYFLKGLNLQRMGLLEEAKRSFRYYLEVRPQDQVAHRLVEDITNETKYLETYLNGKHEENQWIITSQNIKESFNLPVFEILNIKGLGKTISFNNTILLTDQIGNTLSIVNVSNGTKESVSLDEPVTSLFATPNSFLVFSRKGEIDQITRNNNEIKVNKVYQLSHMISDATWISEREIAITDASNRQIIFLSYPDFKIRKTWQPSLEGLFEPVAIDVYGQFLAIADRNNERIIIYNTETGENTCFSSRQPRDIQWGIDGSLFVISDEGQLSNNIIDFNRLDLSQATECGIFPGAWTLFRMRDKIGILDVAGYSYWETYPVPLVSAASGFFSVSHPDVLQSDDSTVLTLQGTFLTPFTSYVKNNVFVASAIWNEQTLKPVVSYPLPVEYDNIAMIEAPLEQDLDQKLNLIWNDKKPFLRHIVVSNAFTLSKEDALTLTSFCIHNGVTLSFFISDKNATLWMERAASLTGGIVAPSLELAQSFEPQNDFLQLSLVLPQSPEISGYPDQSMLALYMDVGLLQTRDWLPLCPNLIQNKK